MYEELLIGDNPQKTIHPKINKTDEPFIPFILLQKTLDELLILLDNQQPDEVKKLLEKSISLYNSNYEISDCIYKEEVSINNKKDDLPIKENQIKVVRIK